MKFVKKPVVIEAVQYNGSSSVKGAIINWMNGEPYREPAIQTRDYSEMHIETLEGVMTASPRDWIIKGIKGEFYPCKPDVFEATYEPLESANDYAND